MRKKILITGAGHSGTTFLTECFEKAGYSVGTAGQKEIHAHEVKDPAKYPTFPDVAKHGQFPLLLPDFLRQGLVSPETIQVVILCWRTDVEELVLALCESDYMEPWSWTKTVIDAEHSLESWKKSYFAAMGRLQHVLTEFEIPTLHVHFPRMALDEPYFRARFQPYLGDQTQKIFLKTADPTRVHRYRVLLHKGTPSSSA